MKILYIALRRFLFAGNVLRVDEAFFTTKTHGLELEANEFARKATAEESQEHSELADEAKQTQEPEELEADTEVEAEEAKAEAEVEAEDEEEQEQEDVGDAESGEAPAAPKPKRRGRKSAS